MSFPQLDPMNKINEKDNSLQKIKERVFGINITTLIKRRGGVF